MDGASNDSGESTIVCVRCSKPARLQCPKCVELKLPRASAAFWPLRPYPISPKRLVPESISKPDWESDGIPKVEPISDLQNTVEIKTPQQIEKMRETCKKAVGIMKAGQTFTIEPMINAGVWRDRMWPDGWTAVTADGKRSAQFEHTLLIAREVLDAAARAIRPGVTTDEIDEVVHDVTIAVGGILPH